MKTTRRSFLATASCAAAAFTAPVRAFAQRKSPFKISVITDEISDDFDHACSVAANDFGLGWVEIRGLWHKTIHQLDSSEVSRAQAILAKYNLRVTDIGSPLFKVHWPGAPRSKSGSQKADDSAILADFKKQDDVLAASIESAKQCHRNHLLKIEDPTPLQTLLQQTPPTTPILWLDPRAQNTAKTLLPTLMQSPPSPEPPLHLLALIGPEGGWSPKEDSLLSTHPNTHPLRLTPTILRIETAAAALAALLLAA